MIQSISINSWKHAIFLLPSSPSFSFVMFRLSLSLSIHLFRLVQIIVSIALGRKFRTSNSTSIKMPHLSYMAVYFVPISFFIFDFFIFIWFFFGFLFCFWKTLILFYEDLFHQGTGTCPEAMHPSHCYLRKINAAQLEQHQNELATPTPSMGRNWK